jgi:polyisoprenyl-phosphate glycosyltransferase
VAAWRLGFDMVYAQRRVREGESWLKRITAESFYRLMGRLGEVDLPRNTGDLRLMSRRVTDAVLQLREQHRIMKGLFAWVGFSTQAVLYDRAPRKARKTKWNYWKLWNLALEGITSFTVLPLKLATYIGLTVAFLAVVYAAQIVLTHLIHWAGGMGWRGWEKFLVWRRIWVLRPSPMPDRNRHTRHAQRYAASRLLASHWRHEGYCHL